MKSFLNGATPISALFSSNKEAFSFSSPFSSSDASGNTATDASGNDSSMFGNMFSSDPSGNTTDASGNDSSMFGNMFSSSSTDTSGKPTTTENTNPSISTYADFFKSLFFLFIKLCIVIYLGASFLCLIRMKKTDLTNYMPSDINIYPYCTPDGTQEYGVEGDSIYSYGFPYNLYCEPDDDDKCAKTCRVIKNELQGSNSFITFIKYTSFSFWLSLSMKNTYATFRAFIKMICIKMGNLTRQNQYDSYGILENVIMLLGALLIYILILCGGFIGFFMTYIFQFYNGGFIVSGLLWTLGMFLISWIPPLFNFFGFIFQVLIMFLWIPFTQNTKYEGGSKENTKVVFEIFKSKKKLLILLFSIGMVMNAFDYLTEYEPYYVLVAVLIFLFNMYGLNSSKDTTSS